MAGLLGGRLAPGFRRRVLVLKPGERRAYRPGEWQNALVMVESGVIHLECRGQAPRRFGAGDLLCFEGLQLDTIRNHGPGPAVLIAVSKVQHKGRKSA
jgi:hypothetical protein